MRMYQKLPAFSIIRALYRLSRNGGQYRAHRVGTWIPAPGANAKPAPRRALHQPDERWPVITAGDISRRPHANQASIVQCG
ncbi:hypothetical protein KCP78_24490 [Salmonella enterica subsp. enterica]|nr:hypothetical protein KCP78_24490 [Salmonella enterica subsp. enterica]